MRHPLLGGGCDERLDFLGDPLGDQRLHLVRALYLLEDAGGEALHVLGEFVQRGLCQSRGTPQTSSDMGAARR